MKTQNSNVFGLGDRRHLWLGGVFSLISLVVFQNCGREKSSPSFTPSGVFDQFSLDQNSDQIENFSFINQDLHAPSSNPNGRPVVRLDTQGHAIDAHDGEIRRFGDKYYLYGTSYDCGFEYLNGGRSADSSFCGFKSYTSPDLVHWTDNGLLFQPDTGLIQQCSNIGCFRPHVLQRRDGRFVLWINLAGPDSGYRVYESSRPDGQFQLVGTPRNLARKTFNGDHTLFKDNDPDQTGYLIYTHYGSELTPELSALGVTQADLADDRITPNLRKYYEPKLMNGIPALDSRGVPLWQVKSRYRETFRIVIEKLNASMTDTVGTSATTARLGTVPFSVADHERFFDALEGGEAPTMFKYNGRYYIINDRACAYCPSGTAVYYSANTPLGPFEFGGSISPTTCGGQVTHAEVIENSVLIMSDLWHQNKPYVFNPEVNDISYRNQARANYYWGKLDFQDGKIGGINCAAKWPNDFPRSPATQLPISDLDQSSGVSGFSAVCDVGTKGGQVARGQIFEIGVDGVLEAIAINTLKGGTVGRLGTLGKLLPQQDLVMELRTVTGQTIGAVVATARLSPASATHSLRKHRFAFSRPVRKGERYAWVLTSNLPSESGGDPCYAVAYTDGNPYMNGSAVVSSNGGATFSTEPARDLRFEAIVKSSNLTTTSSSSTSSSSTSSSSSTTTVRPSTTTTTRAITSTTTSSSSSSTTTTTTQPAAPGSISATPIAKFADHVGPDSFNPDGSLDPGVRVRMIGGVTKRVRSIEVRSQRGGIWDTINTNTYWVVEVVQDSTGALLNAPEHFVDFDFPSGTSISLYLPDTNVSDYVRAGDLITVTLTYSDATQAVATTPYNP